MTANDRAGDNSDAKARFREALDRKAERRLRGEDHRDAHGKSVAHANEKTRRTFRRKSG